MLSKKKIQLILPFGITSSIAIVSTPLVLTSCAKEIAYNGGLESVSVRGIIDKFNEIKDEDGFSCEGNSARLRLGTSSMTFYNADGTSSETYVGTTTKIVLEFDNWEQYSFEYDEDIWGGRYKYTDASFIRTINGYYQDENPDNDFTITSDVYTGKYSYFLYFFSCLKDKNLEKDLSEQIKEEMTDENAQFPSNSSDFKLLANSKVSMGVSANDMFEYKDLFIA